MTDDARSAWRRIEVRHLAALKALAEEASFHGAFVARVFGQPAVSQQLAALERACRPEARQSSACLAAPYADRGRRAPASSACSGDSDDPRGCRSGASPFNGGPLRVGTHQTVALSSPHAAGADAERPDVRSHPDGCSRRREARRRARSRGARAGIRRPADALERSSRSKRLPGTNTSSSSRRMRCAHLAGR